MKQNKRPSKNKANFIGHKKTIKMPYLHKSIFNHLITKKNLKRIIRSLNLHIITNYIKFETLISKYRKMKKRQDIWKWFEIFTLGPLRKRIICRTNRANPCSTKWNTYDTNTPFLYIHPCLVLHCFPKKHRNFRKPKKLTDTHSNLKKINGRYFERMKLRI